MFSPSLSCLIVLLSLALQASATQFCQCENTHDEWKFGGIQHICKDLNNDWCSTNCDFVGGNCDYCQFKPAGQGPDDAYQRLKGWCGKQQEWDSQKQKYVRGTDVICYSYKNRVPPKFGYTGCVHEDNGDWPRDTTVFFRQQDKPGWYLRRGCSNLQRTDWGPLADGFIKRNPLCQAINNNTIHYLIDCPHTDSTKEYEKRRGDFKFDCEYYKGKWYLRHDGPSLEALPDEEASQKALGIPERYPAKLPPSMTHNDADLKEDVQWTSRKSEGNSNAREDTGETTRVVLEEDDVRVVLVDEEL